VAKEGTLYSTIANPQSLKGSLQPTGELVGKLSNIGKLVGRLSPTRTLTGKLSNPGTLHGELSVWYGYYIKYVNVGGENTANNTTLVEEVPLDTYVLNHGVNEITLTHYKDGFDCYLLNVSPARTDATLYLNTRSIDTNRAEIDVVNTGDTYAGSIGVAYWLCVSFSIDAPDPGTDPNGEEDDVNAASVPSVGGGATQNFIIHVNELPTEDINPNAIYILRTALTGDNVPGSGSQPYPDAEEARF